MFWNSSWKFCELAPHTYGCLLVVQEALFLEVCSFSHPAFFCPTLLEGPVEASPSSASWAGQSISSAPPRCLPGRWTFLALELFPFSWAQKDCVDKNVLNGSKQPNICFCILSCFVLLQLITHTHTLSSCNIQLSLSLFFLGEEEPSHPTPAALAARLTPRDSLTWCAWHSFNSLKSPLDQVFYLALRW